MLERLPFEKDYARTEDNETLNRIQVLLRRAYSDLGYEIIDVPATSLKERLELVLSSIDSQ
jgi:predicted ATPase